MELCLLAGGRGIAELLSAILIFVLVLLATYFTARIVGSIEKQKMTGRNIKVVESLRLPGGKNVYLIQAGEKYLLLSESKDRVGLISELPEDFVPLSVDTAEADTTVDFRKLLEKAGNALVKNDRK